MTQDKEIKHPVNFILDWYDSLTKDLQEMLSMKLLFYIPDKFRTEDPDRMHKSRELFRNYIDRKDLHLFSYIKHALTLIGLINYYYDGQGTESDWEKKKDDYLEELSKLQDKEYNEMMLEDLPEILKKGWPKYTEMRIDAIKRYLNNFEKDSITYMYYYNEWVRLCENELSNKSIKEFEKATAELSMFKRF